MGQTCNCGINEFQTNQTEPECESTPQRKQRVESYDVDAAEEIGRLMHESDSDSYLPPIPISASTDSNESSNKSGNRHRRTSTASTGSTGSRGIAAIAQRAEHVMDFMDEILLSSPEVSFQSMNTDGLMGVADDIFSDIQDTVTLKKQSLFGIEGWFEKKGKFGYSKCWVMVKDDYLLWNDREIRVGKAGVTGSEKQRWDVCVKLVNITEVSKITQGKTQRKFRMKIGKRNDIIWKVKDSESRDLIVESLNNHITVRRQENLYR